ncbi:50S ribosomal protein L3 N(5)-glutamine methyltransferase [Halomonas campisalis]|uniref:Ribosomal protein uL3 glutamine methyltransferase n=1 Tax=Billgrantia campisalis TaxID=74661 RepID=A0ABS9PCA7_9GAMM|nr:50S ribosomal protein L3 N(5)-glutamine methyltransferase [Halomonas campisalis]MCG6658725.1 50S ribosomal protein L3 N(5)-glutamine methyltransferase [Halomonas campisalis]MDR5864010.1 50S ribosomal protein L3 N(5)-glutamine methyltransferase [Halomonas campisalis]
MTLFATDPAGSSVAESSAVSRSTLTLDDESLCAGLITLRDCLRWAASEFHLAGLFHGHGTDSPWDEAVALTLGALHLPWNVDPAVLDARLLPMERARIVALVRERIATRRPLPYLLGEAFFAGVPFSVDERVLIPRSPIAELIEDGFAAWFPEEPPARVLDLCTGSGCIGIATALQLPTCEVDLSDISDDALAVARQNIVRHDVGERVRAVASDLFDGLAGRRYELIVCNPPYVDARDLATMPAEFRHEPALALGAGADGLDVVRRLLREAREHLSDDGVLIVEVGNSDRHLEAAFPEVPFLWLDFERGGQGVFALTAAELDAHAASFV